ncbi:MAG TPA: helix-turn-helix domain-containing protein, partial [Kiloniellales bacterium]|nr:helix-turn-helix domain-containing protein [Kiloniellales bacterium]
MARQSLLGNRLRRLRRERRLTQVEMAGALGISPSYLNLIEHNQRALPLPLLPKLAELYDVDIEAFSGGEEARILAELGELFADPLLRDHAVEQPALTELAGNRPELARAILTLYRAYRTNRDDLIGLTERLAEDPELALTFHRLLTLLTTLRSTSEILQDNPGLPDERRRRFVEVLARDSQSMTELVNELIDFFAARGLRRPRGAASPTDEVGDVLQARANHLPELEALAETLHESLALTPVNAGAVLARHLAEAHGLEVAVAGADRTAIGPPPYDRAEGRLVLPEQLSHETRTFELARQLGFHGPGREIDALVAAAPLSSAPARTLYAGALATYFAGALLMPYQAFLDSAR